MSAGFFSIGLSGLGAAQLNLLTTEHNVVNANTPGYTRQRVVQGTNGGVMAVTGAIGQGVTAMTTERLYDRFITAQRNTDQTQTSSLDTYYNQIRQIDSMLADASAGLSPAMQDFFAGVQQVASNPSLLPARQSMISSAETMAGRFHTMNTRLQEMEAQVNDRISSAVTEVNAYASQIGELNRAILISESSYSQPANDLQDQRDQIIAELNKLIKVTTTSNSDGTVNLFVGSGQQLVVGSSVVEMIASESNADPTKIAVGFKVSGTNQELPDSLVVGGELGGLISFRNQALDAATNEIGRVATSLALTFNAQHALGQDLVGNIDHASTPGFEADFFEITNPKIFVNQENVPLASSGANLSVRFADPVAPGSPDFSGNFYTDLTNSDYEVQFAAAGAFTVTRLTDGKTFNAAAGTTSFSFDGITLDIAAASEQPGHRFLIQPYAEVSGSIAVNSSIAADPRLIAAAAPVRVSANIANTGSMSMSQGLVGVGYASFSASLPISLQANATATGLTGITGNWNAVYADPADNNSGAGGTINLVGGTNGSKLIRIEFNSMSFEINGVPNPNDSFTIEKNALGVQDGRNAILFAKLQTQNTTAGGSATFQSSYARLVADNGIRTRESKVQLDARTAILQQSQATRDSLSAVNLDEEAANMIKYQQAYQASAKILDIGGTLFESILAIG